MLALVRCLPCADVLASATDIVPAWKAFDLSGAPQPARFSGGSGLRFLRTGEALSAVLLHATDLGLASCPLSQPLEVSAVRDALRTELLGGSWLPADPAGGVGSGRSAAGDPRRLLSEQIDRFTR